MGSSFAFPQGGVESLPLLRELLLEALCLPQPVGQPLFLFIRPRRLQRASGLCVSTALLFLITSHYLLMPLCVQAGQAPYCARPGLDFVPCSLGGGSSLPLPGWRSSRSWREKMKQPGIKMRAQRHSGGNLLAVDCFLHVLSLLFHSKWTPWE